MPMVSSKLGIRAVERGVAVSFWLLDAVGCIDVNFVSFGKNGLIDIGFQSPS